MNEIKLITISFIWTILQSPFYIATAQTKFIPNPDLVVPDNPFNYTFNHKGNWCSKQAAVLDDKVPLGLALAGETLKVAIPRESEFINYLPDGSTIDDNAPGLIIEFLQEIANRGEFSWEFGFHNRTFDLEGYTMTDLLEWLTQNFDVAGSWWSEISARVHRSVTFPKGWYDNSIIIIGRKKDENKFKIFSWAGPFSDDVWVLLFVTLLVTGFLYFALEKGFSMPSKIRVSELSNINKDIMQYIYRSFVCFSGHMDLRAQTKPGQLISFSLSFFAMLMLSAYTANLASFLVSQNSLQVEVNTVGDIVARGLSMCVLNAAKKEDILSEFPQAIFVDKESEADAYIGLLNGECDYAISSVSGWAISQNDQNTNTDCSLDRIGRVYKTAQAGFAMQSDAGVHCTSLIREVFHHHMLDMYDIGFVQDKWDEHVKRTATLTCSGSSSVGEMTTLTLTNLGGIFILHLILIVLAIIGALFGKYYDTHYYHRVVSSKLITGFSQRFFVDSTEEIHDDNDEQTTDLTTLRLHVTTVLQKLDQMENKKTKSKQITNGAMKQGDLVYNGSMVTKNTSRFNNARGHVSFSEDASALSQSIASVDME